MGIRIKQFSIVSAVIIACALSFVGTARAQQITYYDFDVPQANNGYSYACIDPAQGPLAVPNPLLCLNSLGTSQPPQFIQDTYPPAIDPLAYDNPPVQSTHYALQTTASVAAQANSVFFSVPQIVSKGFNAYFAFKLTPNPASYATADGLAFVIQNALGGGQNGCKETGSGPNVVGGDGGCIGYGGIDNSLAIEFDTYRNVWDPTDLTTSTYDDNHIAIQNCEIGVANSPDHNGSCLATLGVPGRGGATVKAINSALPVTLADGNVHQVVVIYSGPTEAVPNLLQIYIDPPFLPGTHSPAPSAVPVISGTYNLAAHLNLQNSGMPGDTTNDAAYVGFTSATGSAFEQSEVLAWTYTPHTAVTQRQPLNPPGIPTTFPFGAHVFAVTYPIGGPDTAGIDMIVTANTVAPSFFTTLINGTSFKGSECEVYDETGGNCIIYSVSCAIHGTNTFVQCPATTDPTNPIGVKSAYNNTIQPASPGFLQGDPLYNQLETITSDGQTATVICTGECAVTQGQAITIAGSTTGSGPSVFNGSYTVASASPSMPNVFTFAFPAPPATATGGYITSNNVQDIFSNYVPQRYDGTTTGKTKNFSDLVVTSATRSTSMLMIQAPPTFYGTPASVTITISSINGTPTGNVTLSVDNGTPITQALNNGMAVFQLSGLSVGTHQLRAVYSGQGAFPGATASTTIKVLPGTLTFNPINAYFGNVGVGSTSAPVTVQVTNNSSYTASYASSTGLNEFNLQGGTCGPINPTLTLAAGASCTFSATFSPTAAGQAIGSFTISTGSSQVTFTLKGYGVPGVLTFKPGSASFGSVAAGTTSQPLSIAVSNYTTGSPTYISNSNLGTFGFNGGSCGPISSGTTLPAGQSCSFQVTFSPTTTGPVTGSFTLGTSAGPVTFSLNGTGVNPSFVFTPTSATFGNVGVGTSSPIISVTAHNYTGSQATYLQSSGLGGFNFSAGTCGANYSTMSLPANSSCTFGVSLSPTGLGPVNGSITVSTAVGPVTFNLSGTGVASTFVFNPPSANFGNAGIGTTSQAISVTATNYTSSAVTYLQSSGLSNYTFSGGTCGATATSTSLPANSSCTFSVAFSPTAPGPANGSFSLGTSAGPVSFPLSGTGVPATFSFNPPSIDFGVIAPGTMSSPVVVTATNYTGSTVAAGMATGMSSFNFQPITCGASTAILPDTSCTFQVTFSPTSTSASMGSLVVNTTSGPVTLTLAGNP